MDILAFFTNQGIPATGLTPTIRIRDVSDGTLLVTDASMTEVGDGHYKYTFAAYDAKAEYAIRCDGGVVLPSSERYTYAGNENYVDDIGETITETTSGDFNSISSQISASYSDIAREVWSTPVSAYSGKNMTGAMQSLLYGNSVYIDTVNGTNNGVDFPTGTLKFPVDNFNDCILIARERGITNVITNDSLSILSGIDATDLVFMTPGYMDTYITIDAGASVDRSAFRYLNLQGEISDGDIVLIENCTIYNLDNFSGVMNNVALGESSEISLGTSSWAQMIHVTAAGDSGNEPEISIGDSILNISQLTGNLKLKDKTGTDRTTINSTSSFIIIDSTCVSGSIELIGTGGFQDNSGPNCQVDTDAFISLLTISDYVWEESLGEHLNDGTTGKKLFDIDTRVQSLSASNEANFTDIDNTLVDIENKVDNISVSGGSATPDQIAQAVWSENPSGYSGINNFGGLMREMSEDLKRLLGLTHENIFIDNPTYDADGNLTGARVRIYSNPASVGTSNDVLGTYTISAPSNAPGQFINWQQVRTS